MGVRDKIRVSFDVRTYSLELEAWKWVGLCPSPPQCRNRVVSRGGPPQCTTITGGPASSPRVVRGRDSEAPPGREAPRPGHDSRVARVRLSQTGPARTAERIVGKTMSAGWEEYR